MISIRCLVRSYAAAHSKARPAWSSIDDHIVVLNSDRDGLGTIRTFDNSLPWLDVHGEGTGTGLDDAAERPSSLDVELPAVPGAADDLAFARIGVVAWIGGLQEASHRACGETAPVMGAFVEQGEVVAPNIEDDDGATIDVDQTARARREVGSRGDDMARHQRL